MIKFTSLFSGSHGNSLLISSGSTHILIDAGFTYSTLKKALATIELTPQQISAIVVTHEHNDHISALAHWCDFNKQTPIYAHKNIAHILDSKCRGNIVSFDKPFDIMDIHVDWTKCNHDSVFCCGYRMTDYNSSFASITDTGMFRQDLVDFLQPCRTVLVESNHDVTMVDRGNYPYLLKKRILSNNGHLSNEQCAQILDKLIQQGNVHNIILGHLSQNNNTSELAFCRANEVITANGLTEGKDVNLYVAQQYTRSITIE